MEPRKINWEQILREQIESSPKIVSTENSSKQYKIVYKMKPEDIMTFVSGLHDIQHDMIETVVMKKEKEGFPEARAVIEHIKGLK